MDQESQTLQTSPFHTWVGVVAADKGINDISIEVVVPELNPSLTGQVGVATSSQSVTLTDLNGGQINSTVTTKTTITAYYYGNNTNRTFPPDVVKGEQVRIIRFSNSDKYYWESMGRDDGLRKTETLRFEVKDRQNFNDPSDDSHTYSIELDSKRAGHVRILTSKGNGEPYAYTLLFDTKNGKVQLSDDIGNAFTIDSANSKVIVRNSKSAFLMLNGLDAIFAAPRDVTIKAGRQMLIDSGLLTINSTSGSGIVAINSKSIAMNATGSITSKAPAIGLSGAVQAPTLVAAAVQASAITQGAPAAPYQPASINLGAGTGNSPINTPNAPSGGVSVQWASGGGGGGGGSGGSGSGSGDSSLLSVETVITYPNQTIPLTGTPTWTALYVNGLRQDNSGYSIGSDSVTVSSEIAATGDLVRIDYQP